MFEFFGNIFYLLLLGLILVITYITTRNAWSKEILSRRPNALIWNNPLVILGIIIIVTIFFLFSWTAGVATITLVLIVYIFIGSKIQKKIETEIIDSNKEKNKS